MKVNLSEIPLDQGMIDTFNAISPLVAVGIRVELRKTLNPDPGRLPRVVFEDTEWTRQRLGELTAWTTPLDVQSVSTLFGQSVERIAIHPEVISQRAADIMEKLGDEGVGRFASQYGLDRNDVLRHFRNRAALGLLAENILVGVTQIDKSSKASIYSKAIELALDLWEQDQRRD